MALRFLNTYSQQVENFAPLEKYARRVTIYTCGPTVYHFAHIGNWRAYIFEDLLQRHLEFRGHEVVRVMNLTDVDDKTIRGSREAKLPLTEYTEKFKRAFFEDLEVLRIKRANFYPAATEPVYVEKMIAMISELIRKGVAYQAEDRSVYFRISKFANYGKLAHLNLDELRSSGRVQSDEYEKESVGDFALWKAWDAEDGDVGWESPWGRGRPGWHIECSAMATALLGEQIDIHCGGMDNIFPHHEAEIAQCEACSGKMFARYWLHCAHLMVEGRKMAKSLGNFYTLRDLLGKGWAAREVRYALISVNYRLPLNFTFEGLTAARNALHRIDAWTERVEAAAGAEQSASDFKLDHQEMFAGTLDDDLNISGALGHLFDTIRESNALMDDDRLSPRDALALLKWWNAINETLQLSPERETPSAEVMDLVAGRATARQKSAGQRATLCGRKFASWVGKSKTPRTAKN